MATLLLSAAAAAIGGSFGGSVMGLAAGAIGKAAGATVGALIDQRLTGLGSEPVETGRVERFRVMGASEGAALPRIYGRFRVAGQVIWSSSFLENVDTSRVGGKGGGGQSQTVREFSYSISLAIAICEGEIARVGRIWADGQRLDLAGVTWRLHHGSEAQLPDPVIAAIEGADAAPAYRGAAYVVFENLDLTPFGNRIPQFNFEVFRRPKEVDGLPRPPALDVRGVALVPGTGEYALATTPVHVSYDKGATIAANVNNDRGRPDLIVSLEQMQAELPAVKAVSLVVSWFGDDLRCDRCTLRPAVEQAQQDGQEMAWRVAGVGRFEAKLVSRADGRPMFGGTPSDASVLQAIAQLRASGQSVMFYPFILMDIPSGNGLEDPWSGGANQPAVPWRGRITLSRAPGRPGTPDKTPSAAAEVARFFGTAQANDFRVENGAVLYDGPLEWSYRRFVLHYAHLCALSGGVDAFCIGSEMRSLTQIRNAADRYPAVLALCALAEDVRSVLGPEVKLGYAADWSEYFGHHATDGSGDVLFHLDDLWAHPAIDFVGIDNYMPLSDWRDGAGHADAAAGSIYNLAYLTGNVAAGEGFDWYYADADDRERQRRQAISDGAYGEPWIFRYKDIVNWWSRAHVNRIGGAKVGSATPWRPRSKPIWFTELGCPAIDKATNQPNVFHDPKSSESFFPYFSSGVGDGYIQHRYLQAMFAFWGNPDNNPASDVYPGSMLDMDRAYVWAWDARPWPDFPDRLETWIDGLNYHLGHWINARLAAPSLGEIVADVCERSGAQAVDVTGLRGVATGFSIGTVETGRQSLQSLMLAYGFDSFASAGRLVFSHRGGDVALEFAAGDLVSSPDEPAVTSTRSSPAEAPGRVALEFVRADLDYQTGVAEVVSPEIAEPDTARSSIAVVLSEGQAKAVSERWLTEARVAKDSVQFAVSPAQVALGPGDLVSFAGAGTSNLYRVDRIEELGTRAVTAVRVEPGLYQAPAYEIPAARSKPAPTLSPVYAEFLDLPLLVGSEDPIAPRIAVAKTPWAGSVAVYSSASDVGYSLNREVRRPAVVGATLEPLRSGVPGLWSNDALRVRLATGSLQSREADDVLNGANAAALRFGDRGEWEVIQFASAELIGDRQYRLSGLLRGQAGTDGVTPPAWPVGTDFVLLDAGVIQLQQAADARGLERHYRVGPATRPYDDASFLHVVHTFYGVGLRPYKPVHLRARRRLDGAIEVRWIRRTRVGGDSWDSAEVPLAEERELYRITTRIGDRVVREAHSVECLHVYEVEDQLADAAQSNIEFGVAQVSAQFGPGPAAKLSFLGDTPAA